MKKSKRDFSNYNIYKQIRKPMPPSERVILNDKDLQKEQEFDWRKELNELEELEDEQNKGGNDGNGDKSSSGRGEG